MLARVKIIRVKLKTVNFENVLLDSSIYTYYREGLYFNLSISTTQRKMSRTAAALFLGEQICVACKWVFGRVGARVENMC